MHRKFWIGFFLVLSVAFFGWLVRLSSNEPVATPAVVQVASPTVLVEIPTVTPLFAGPVVSGLTYSDVCDPGGIAAFTLPSVGNLKAECLENTPYDTSEYHFRHEFSMSGSEWVTFSNAYMFPVSLAMHTANRLWFYTSCVGSCQYSIISATGSILQTFNAETDVWADITFEMDEKLVWVLVEYQGLGGYGLEELSLGLYAQRQLEVFP